MAEENKNAGSIGSKKEREEMKELMIEQLKDQGIYDELVAKARCALIDCGWGAQMANKA